MASAKIQLLANTLVKKCNNYRDKFKEIMQDTALEVHSEIYALCDVLKEGELKFDINDLLKITDFCLPYYDHIYKIYPEFFEDLKERNPNSVVVKLYEKLSDMRDTLYYLNDLI